MGVGVSPLYDKVVHIASDYLGPTADRFMRRQIETHLRKKPEQLQPGDIIELVDWVRLTFALLTNDAKLIHAFSDRLLALATDTHQSRKRRHA